MKLGSETESLKRRLTEAQENLRLIRERKSEFVQETDIPLQLIKDERRLEQEVKALRAQLAQQRVLVKGSDVIPLLSSVLGFLVGVLGNLVAAWIQRDLLSNAFTPVRIGVIVLLAAAGLGAGILVRGQQPPSKKQWAMIAAGVVVLMVPLATVFALRNSIDTNHPPSIQRMIASPSTLIVGQEATLTVIAMDVDGDNLVYYWEAQKGTVPPGTQSDTVTYTASATSGLDTIKVTVTDGNASATQAIKLVVLAPDGSGR